jgi:hypothetical protein
MNPTGVSLYLYFAKEKNKVYFLLNNEGPTAFVNIDFTLHNYFIVGKEGTNSLCLEIQEGAMVREKLSRKDPNGKASLKFTTNVMVCE